MAAYVVCSYRHLFARYVCMSAQTNTNFFSFSSIGCSEGKFVEDLNFVYAGFSLHTNDTKFSCGRRRTIDQRRMNTEQEQQMRLFAVSRRDNGFWFRKTRINVNENKTNKIMKFFVCILSLIRLAAISWESSRKLFVFAINDFVRLRTGLKISFWKVDNIYCTPENAFRPETKQHYGQILNW